MLFLAGENTRLGKVDEGTSLMDYEPEEIDRKATISATLACFDWNKYKINMIDTPGDDNFIYDAKLCMKVVDGAIILVGAVSGVRVGTEKVWDYANEFGVPVCFFVNKMDRERADFGRTVEDLRKNFTDKSIVPVQIPIGAEDAFKGVIDLISMKAYISKDDQSGAFDDGGDPRRVRGGGGEIQGEADRVGRGDGRRGDGAVPERRRDRGRGDRDLPERAASGAGGSRPSWSGAAAKVSACSASSTTSSSTSPIPSTREGGGHRPEDGQGHGAGRCRRASLSAPSYSRPSPTLSRAS